MAFNTVAILSPGDMGHAVGQRLRENELDVVTCLAGRSERTLALAEKAGIRDVSTMEELVEQSDLIMSMTVSAAVPALCREVAGAIKATGADTLFAECNAIAPQLTCKMEPIITEAGSRFVDVSIIGGPASPRLQSALLYIWRARHRVCAAERLRSDRHKTGRGRGAGIRHKDVLCRHDQGDFGSSFGVAYSR